MKTDTERRAGLWGPGAGIGAGRDGMEPGCSSPGGGRGWRRRRQRVHEGSRGPRAGDGESRDAPGDSHAAALARGAGGVSQKSKRVVGHERLGVCRQPPCEGRRGGAAAMR